MYNTIVRLQQIELINFKNVKNGTIVFPSYMKQDCNRKAEIIGLYGQNGSGKTALIDAMWILQHALTGKKLPLNTKDYILQTSLSSELNFVFSLELQEERYLVFYEIELSKTKDNKLQFTKENLSYKRFSNGEWKNKSGIIDYNTDYNITIFKPLKNFKLLTASNPNNHINLGVSKKLSQKNITSFIFSSETEEAIKCCDSFKEYTDIILNLKYYATHNLFIIQNNSDNTLNMNLFNPSNYEISDYKSISQGYLSISLLTPSVVDKQVFDLLNKILKQMNIVLETIIPGLNIDIKNHGKQLKEDGSEGVRIELVSIRETIIIPLKYESDGIKKIISILSTLILVFNNPSVCMVVDELDAGIFEYLLGEILQIINENGKGQLIFTSHNLRPLEMLDTNSLIFTTTNPNNRYSRFANVKSNNNLRNLYYRSINVGGQKEDIYEETNNFEISRAFRVAGRMIDEH
ncbi:AAA family ATPase [Alkalibaculum sp. M08DMB]|uniref:AAA family ATPase n=1 Tax=Alkalibaculum sporogenes TaxID=2655001 RepID=A0A6A7K8F1_9FIRM|nr:AAA family ATPase [Alkalibaculum sporogenes]MPW25662.1 AAA family ATPase [Alkalibaculum sporogenes]